MQTREQVLTSNQQVSLAIAPVIGANNWKSPLSQDATLEDVLDRATGTILKLETKGAALPL